MLRAPLLSICGLVAACASRPLPAVTLHDSHPHYPVTVIRISDSLTLRHVARAAVHDSDAARSLVPDYDRTLSTYTLMDAHGRKLVTAPSALIDPRAKADEFQIHHLKNDALTVLASANRNTILIIEDITTAIPGEAYILLRRRPDATWMWSSFDVPRFPQNGWYLERWWPAIAGLSDSKIWYHLEERPRWRGIEGKCLRVKERTWSQSLDEIKPGNYLDYPKR